MRTWVVDEDVEVLHGGVANAGAVIREGGHVLRPANEHSVSMERFDRRRRWWAETRPSFEAALR